MKAWTPASAQRRAGPVLRELLPALAPTQHRVICSLSSLIPAQGDRNNPGSRLPLFIWSVSILCDQTWEWTNESWRAWNRENRKLRIGFDDLWSVLTCVARGPGHNRGAGDVAVEEDLSNELGGLLLNETWYCYFDWKLLLLGMDLWKILMSG